MFEIAYDFAIILSTFSALLRQLSPWLVYGKREDRNDQTEDKQRLTAALKENQNETTKQFFFDALRPKSTAMVLAAW